jgi:uncharacterized protein YjbI with pentapeptide repeats
MAQQSGRIQVFESLTPRQQRSTLVGILVFVAVVTSVVNALANGDADWQGLADNFSTELLGAALTFFIFDLFQERRDNLWLRQRLIREMRSPDNATALNAVEELRHLRSFWDGSLHGAALSYANLERANLIETNLPGADMRRANLQDANLDGANLHYAKLFGANLHNANLFGANLQMANLFGANLQKADLTRANLRGARLSNARLEGTNLSEANLQGVDLATNSFDENTALPDDDPWGESSHWTPDTDMARFTDPDHPDFWRSDEPASPAYRGGEEDNEEE